MLLGLALASSAVGLSSLASCKGDVPNPYATSSTGTGFGGMGGAGGAPVDPELGGPCVDDGQCNDGIDCTFDACDKTLSRCRFKPDDSLCQNAIYCDGVERCDQKIGCQPGPPKDCGDMDACTIDTCVESSKTCTNVLRDADGDGDPDAHCTGGDCDDQNPAVSSLVPEICGNQIDDNCNGQVDEPGCISPAHDTCADALAITQSGVYLLDTAGASEDYATSCLPMGTPLRDVVAAVELAPGPLVDVVATAHSATTEVALALAGQCGSPGSEIACGGSFTAVGGGKVAKIHAHGLGDAALATALPLYVTTLKSSPVSLEVQIVPATAPPTNETCGTAIALVPGTPVVADLVGAKVDVASACPHPTGDLVYSFTLAAPSDVDLYAASIDGDGQPSISLRDAGCALPTDEITCDVDLAPHVYRHSLPAGTYYVSVAATAPTSVSLDVVLSPPTAPPPDDTCVGSPALVPGKTIDLTYAHHQDDLSLGCLAGAVDAAYELDLAEASDVLLVERTSQGDDAAVELALPSCAAPSDLLVCGAGTKSPVRAQKRNVAAGAYRVIAESTLAQDQQLTALVRKTAPATIATFSDACADRMIIPPQGAFFQGNTANAMADFPAGCDSAGGAPNGAPDQMFELDLVATKRVVFDMSGSGYNTLLDVRSGPSCPGTEVTGGCSAAISGSKSFLDLTLAPGTYFVQVDGLAGDTGPWFLNVFVVDP